MKLSFHLHFCKSKHRAANDSLIEARAEGYVSSMMDGIDDYSRSEKSTHHLSSSAQSENDESSVDGTETSSSSSSSSSSGHIVDETSTELKPYLEIGKQLNVSVSVASFLIFFCLGIVIG